MGKVHALETHIVQEDPQDIRNALIHIGGPSLRVAPKLTSAPCNEPAFPLSGDEIFGVLDFRNSIRLATAFHHKPRAVELAAGQQVAQ